MAVKKAESEGLHIDPLKQGRVTLTLVGMTPLYFNAMSVKAKRTLLLGGGKKKDAAPVTPEKEGYDEQERERLDKLFNEPVTNE